MKGGLDKGNDDHDTEVILKTLQVFIICFINPPPIGTPVPKSLNLRFVGPHKKHPPSLHECACFNNVVLYV